MGDAKYLFMSSPDLHSTLKYFVKANKVAIFSKTFCPYCKKVKDLFRSMRVPFACVELDLLGNVGQKLQVILTQTTGQKTVPSVFIGGVHRGGCDDVTKLKESSRLTYLLNEAPQKVLPENPELSTSISSYDYDLFVIGGGSAGISCALQAVELGANVALCNFVAPSPVGTQWGLGGTCVNVGCIPKILFHEAARVGNDLEALTQFGWVRNDQQQQAGETGSMKHDWFKLTSEIQGYIRKLNQQNAQLLKDKKIAYFEARAQFGSPNSVILVDADGNEKSVTAKNIVIATGKRPRYPDDVIGAKEHCLTSDDIFSLPYQPGRVLLYGGGYIALETAGFLR
jgi:thioredoxin reductase (NADPH)